MSTASPGISSRRRTSLLWLILLFLVAVLVRLAAIHRLAEPPQRDELDNHLLAVNLLAGEGDAVTPSRPNTYLRPVYPVFIASIHAISGPDYRVVWYVQAALNSILFLLRRYLFDATVFPFIAGLACLLVVHRLVHR